MDDPEFRAKVEAVHHEIASLGDDIITPVPNYYLSSPPDENLVSADRKTTIMPFIMTGGYEPDAVKNVQHVVEVVEEANGRGTASECSR